MIEKLYELGLSEDVKVEYYKTNENCNLGRVIAEYKGLYKVATEGSDILAKVTGNFIKTAFNTSDFPAVGDWVIVDRTLQYYWRWNNIKGVTKKKLCLKKGSR